MELSTDELRAVTAYAVACAEPALAIFERSRPADQRPRQALDAARTFAAGGRRTKAIRDGAWGAQRAYQETRDAARTLTPNSPAQLTLLAASEAARATVAAASAAFLHPLANATQVLHILGAAGHAAHAFELDAGDSPDAALAHLERTNVLSVPTVVAVLKRYPAPPPGRGRAGELVRLLDASLRAAP